ncbi:SH3 domain-containing protein [Streptomyces sp. NPDC057654]|uniref:SH3 domain-containing protein n=1 Tax=Streptomyces sp. NPDC057654 TaxID=3346196 RepID=UPI0036CD39DD
MRSTRIAVSAALIGAAALPLLSAPNAGAATAPTVTRAAVDDCSYLPPLPYTVHTQAVTIRSRATAHSTALGLLYKGHRFTVSRTSGNWHYITDKSTGVKGWVSGSYVYRDGRMCLD